SGVAGGIIAVLPGQFGIGIFSPRLDDHGNSVRGIKVCNDLSRMFNLHLFNSPHSAKAVIRLKFTGSDVNSSCVRTTEEARLLRQHGRAAHVYQLQGNMVFSTAEILFHDIMQSVADTQYLILDFKHTLTVDESACRLLYELLLKFEAANKTIIFTNIARRPGLRRYFKAKLGQKFESLFLTFEGDDAALEWCENHILKPHQAPKTEDSCAQPRDYELFHGLTTEEINVVAGLLERRRYGKGSVMVQFGEPSGELYFVHRGKASVTVGLSGGAQKRLAMFSAGMAFGEMALIDHAPRSAVVTADTEVECDLLRVDHFEALGTTHPHIKIVLLSNLALVLSRKLRKANREISVFDY
ncbi:MAG TPA: glutaminase, partial [Roseimicrobium sp.]|nr:glutaminase [Roseimicrobium sp.]